MKPVSWKPQDAADFIQLNQICSLIPGPFSISIFPPPRPAPSPPVRGASCETGLAQREVRDLILLLETKYIPKAGCFQAKFSPTTFPRDSNIFIEYLRRVTASDSANSSDHVLRRF